MLNCVHENMTIDERGRIAASKSLDKDVVTPAYGAYREALVKPLNNSLTTELMYVVKHKCHHFMTTELSWFAIADECLIHLNEDAAHADRNSKRIVLLSVEPNFLPNNLSVCSPAANDESNKLKIVICVNLIADRIAVKTYRELIELVGKKDSKTHCMPEDFLADEEEHADSLNDCLKQ